MLYIKILNFRKGYFIATKIKKTLERVQKMVMSTRDCALTPFQTLGRGNIGQASLGSIYTTVVRH